MKKLVLILAIAMSFPLAALAEPPEKLQKTKYLSDLERKNAFSFEYWGRTMAWSVNFDHLVTDSIGLGVGLYFTSASSGGTTASAMILPIYGNFYFMSEEHRPFVTAGIDVVTLSISGFGSGAGTALVFGGGYEYRGDSGMLFRVAPYLISAGSSVTITAGASVGYAF